MKSILFLTASVLVLAGCMTDKEYQLRAKDIEAKAAHPATYQPLVLNGPLELREGHGGQNLASKNKKWRTQKGLCAQVPHRALLGYITPKCCL